jgi:signal peptidase II
VTVAGTGDGGETLEQAARGLAGTSDPVSGVTDRGRPRWRAFLGLAAAIGVTDQLTKAWLVNRLAPGESMDVLGDTVRLVHGQNSGALFGLFRDQALLFGVASLAVIALIVAYHARSARSTYVSITLGLLLGGAIGNLIDRFRLGHVVDFIDVGIGDVRFYTFNVADSAVSTAILLLIVAALVPALTGGRSGDPDA